MIWTWSLMQKRSCCMRIGPQYDRHCEKITTTDGREPPWVDEVRYLGIFIVRFIKFKCSVNHAKRPFFRTANGIFAKVGRLASEEVILDSCCFIGDFFVMTILFCVLWQFGWTRTF